jgi:hypothetical protein
MNNQNSILNNAGLEAISDDQLAAVAGGTTFRVNAETDASVIVVVHKTLGDYPSNRHSV